MRFRPFDQHADERVKRDDRDRRRIAHEEHHIRCNLVVARSRSVQLAADRADELGQPALDRAVDVLIVGRKLEAPVTQLLLDDAEAAQELPQVGVADDRAACEHHRVRPRLGEVVRPQALVEGQRGVDPLKVGVLWLGEA